MPVTKVKTNEQTYYDDYNDNWTKALQDDTQNSAGMPVCIQVVGYAFQDEKVLGLMKKLEEKIAFKSELPGEAEPTSYKHSVKFGSNKSIYSKSVSRSSGMERHTLN